MQCILNAWNAYEAELLRFVRSKIANDEAASDLVQEVFLRAQKQPNGLCGVGSPRAWLFQVARNLLIDRHRLSKDEITLDEDIPDTSETEMLPIDSLSECLPRVLAELSVKDREVITLCDIEGMTQQAFATHSALSLPAAKARLQRARKRLHERLIDACQVRFDEQGKVCCFIRRTPIDR